MTELKTQRDEKMLPEQSNLRANTKIEKSGRKRRRINCMCLRPHGSSENFIKAWFIIRNTTFFLFYIHKVITFSIYIIILHKLLW